ncbi:MAG: hypothetical protein ACK58L_04625 [Planctomycetota bacterium]
MIPLEDLLGQGLVEELLQRSLEQRTVPRFTIDRIELSGEIQRDEVRLTMDMQVKIEPKSEWVTIPIALGDVFVTGFTSTSPDEGRAILTTAEQNNRQWHIQGQGVHTLKMDFVGKSRMVSPGVSQLTLNLPRSTSAHAVLKFAAPVDLQKLPTGAVSRTKSAGEGLRGIQEAEFWLANNFSLTWSEVVAPIAQKPVIQSQSRLKLDLTTIPVTMSGTQTLTISGSAVNELTVTFPPGFQLLELDARNPSGASVIKPFRIPPTSSEPLTLAVLLTSAIDGQLTMSFEMELMNRQFPQDIRLVSPVVRDANFQPGDLDLLFPTGLLVQHTELKDTQRIRVTSEADLSVATTAYRMRSPESQIVLHVEETEAQFGVSPEITLTPDNNNVIMKMRFPISVLKGSMLDMEIDWPGWSTGEWQILPKTLRLINDKSQIPLAIQPSESEQDVLQLTFPERQSGEFVIEFDAFAALADVRSGKTQLRCPEIKSRKGRGIELITTESDQFSILPVNMGTGESLKVAPGVAIPDRANAISRLRSERWIHDDPSAPIRLELREQFPSVQAEITLGLLPREYGIDVVESIRFDIEHRDLAELSLQVPEGLRPTVRIPGQSEPLRGTIESSNWRFRLPETRRGNLNIEVSYLWPVPPPDQENAALEFQVPVVMPLFEDSGSEVRSLVAGTRALSGLKVLENSAWQPIFSESFELAWGTSRPTLTVPVRWEDRRQFDLTTRPDLLLVRTQIVGRFAVTTTVVVCNSAPQSLAVETPINVDVEDITLGSASLTSSGSTVIDRLRQKRLPDDQRIRWQIKTDSSESFTESSPMILTIRTREPLRDVSSLWDQRSFRRTLVAGESSATPILWFIGSQDEYQVTAATDAYSCLTHRSATILPGGKSVRDIAGDQISAVVSSFPPAIRASLLSISDEWLSQTGRQDVFFGSAGAQELNLTLLPGVSLLLVSAAVCVFLFLVMAFVRQLPMAVPILFVICLSLVTWLIWPEWTLVLAPYILIGILIGVVSMTLQRYMSDRRVRFPIAMRSEELPTVFGFTGMLAPPVETHIDAVMPEVASQPEFSTSSAR